MVSAVQAEVPAVLATLDAAQRAQAAAARRSLGAVTKVPAVTRPRSRGHSLGGGSPVSGDGVLGADQIFLQAPNLASDVRARSESSIKHKRFIVLVEFWCTACLCTLALGVAA